MRGIEEAPWNERVAVKEQAVIRVNQRCRRAENGGGVVSLPVVTFASIWKVPSQAVPLSCLRFLRPPEALPEDLHRHHFG